MVFLKRFLTNIYVYFHTVFLKIFYKKKSNKNVLIIIDGLIGDTILIQDFLKECERYFCADLGYSVELFFSKSFVRKFYLECCNLYDFKVLNICFEKKNAELMDMLKVLSFFKKRNYEYVLNPLPKHKGDKLVGCIRGKHKLAVSDDLTIEGRRAGSLFRKVAYTQTIVVPKTEMEFCRYKKLLVMAGDNKYSMNPPKLNVLEKSREEHEPYCVLAVGASEAGKKWSLDKYVQLADYILKQYQMPIIFVGGQGDLSDVSYVLNKIINKEKVKNVCGSTTYQGWVEVIQNARIVIGNDSASVHIAAAVGVKSICIVGKWQYKRFYPYITDKKSDYLPMPVFCNQTLACENCGKVIDLMPNSNCRKTVSTLGSYDCVKFISVEQIMEAVDYVLKE